MGLSFVFHEGPVKLKNNTKGDVNANLSRRLPSDSSHLGGRLVSVVLVENNEEDFALNPTGTPSGCVKMAAVQNQKIQNQNE